MKVLSMPIEKVGCLLLFCYKLMESWHFLCQEGSFAEK